MDHVLPLMSGQHPLALLDRHHCNWLDPLRNVGVSLKVAVTCSSVEIILRFVLRKWKQGSAYLDLAEVLAKEYHQV